MLVKEISSCEPCYSWNIFHSYELGDRENFTKGVYSLFAGGGNRQTFLSCETRDAVSRLTLPPPFRVTLVPASQPRTKPKACNIGLELARGQYLVVYDAEDRPEPDQLRKAVAGFQRAGERVICLQSRLNFYNPRQNLLTRLFTAEYTAWFDLSLPGLSAVQGVIPLGGTSNHFMTDKLKELLGHTLKEVFV